MGDINSLVYSEISMEIPKEILSSDPDHVYAFVAYKLGKEFWDGAIETAQLQGYEPVYRSDNLDFATFFNPIVSEFDNYFRKNKHVLMKKEKSYD